MKKPFYALIAFSFVLFLTACGTSDNSTETEQVTDPTNGEENMENTVTTTIDVKDNGDAVLLIENKSQEDLELTFTSGQEVEYQLLDKEKNVLYTYSANKMFTQMIQEKILAPNDKLEVQLDLLNELAAANIPAGSYTLIAWSPAKEIADQKAEVAYEWAGNEKDESVQAFHQVTLYHGDPTSSFVEPYQATVDPNKDIVMEIFNQLDTEVTLKDYSFENEDKTLKLDMSGLLENIQGTAGENIFVGSILHSYFDTFPVLEEIIFQEDGDFATLPHFGKVEAFTRDDIFTKPE